MISRILSSTVILAVLGSSPVFAANSDSLKKLGNQEMLLDKARPSVPANTYRIVQKRVIDRESRFELAAGLGGITGGDSYYNTKNVGLQAEYHFTHRWSAGLRYLYNMNELTSEGKRVYDQAEATIDANNPGAAKAPGIDWPMSTTLATISFYPLYGKMSWFDLNVSYFDMYVLLGGGVNQLRYGTVPVYTGGLGMGMWWTNHLSSRIEARYQEYDDHLFGGRRIKDANISFSMGFLL